MSLVASMFQTGNLIAFILVKTLGNATIASYRYDYDRTHPIRSFAVSTWHS